MERRQGIRRNINFEVLMVNSTNTNHTLIMRVVNISDIGIYALSEGQSMPTLGSLVQVKLNEPIHQDGEHPLLDMLITRVDSQGIGLQYVKKHQNIESSRRL